MSHAPGPRPPVPAPWWRRAGAGTVDGLLGLAMVAAGIGAGFVWVTRVRPDRAQHWGAEATKAWWTRHGSEMQVGMVAFQCAGRNWRSPGQRVFGVRRVDERTGGPITIRSVVIRSVAERGWSALARRLVGPYQERRRAQLQTVQAEVRAIREAHHDDEDGEQATIMDLQRGGRMDGLRSCLPHLVVGLAPRVLLLTPHGRRLAERFGRTVTVLEPSAGGRPA